MKKNSLLIALIMLCPLFAGCESAIQPVKQAYVLSIGIDKGEKKDYKITFQIPFLTTEAGSGQDTNYTIAIECESLVDAINAVNVSNPSNITLTHVNFVVFGEDFLKDMGAGGLIISLCRNVQMNWTASLFACKGTAEDYIKGIQLEKATDLDSLQDNIIDVSDRSGFYPDLQLIDAYDSILNNEGFACALAAGNKDAIKQLEEKESGGSDNGGSSATDESSRLGEDVAALAPGGQQEQQEADPSPDQQGQQSSQSGQGGSGNAQEKMGKLNLLQTPGEFERTGGLGSDISGAAIIMDGKIVGEISGHDARGLLMIRDEFVQSSIVITNPFDETGLMAIKVKRAKGPNIKVTIDGDRPRVQVKLFLMINSYTYNKAEDYTMPDKREQLAKHMNTSIKQEIDTMLEKVKGYGVDVLGLSKYAAKCFATQKEFEDYNWAEKFKQAEIDVIVETWIIHPDFDKLKEVSD